MSPGSMAKIFFLKALADFSQASEVDPKDAHNVVWVGVAGRHNKGSKSDIPSNNLSNAH